MVSALARPGGSGRDCRSTADARGLRTMAFEVASSCSSQLVLVLCVLAHSAGSDGGGGLGAAGGAIYGAGACGACWDAVFGGIIIVFIRTS